MNILTQVISLKYALNSLELCNKFLKLHTEKYKTDPDTSGWHLPGQDGREVGREELAPA